MTNQSFGKRSVEMTEKHNEKRFYVKGEIPQVRRLYINVLTKELFTPDLDTWDWQDPFGCCRVDRHDGRFYLPLVIGKYASHRIKEVPQWLKWKEVGSHMGEFCFVHNGQVIDFDGEIAFRYLRAVGVSCYERDSEGRMYFSEFQKAVYKVDRRDRDTY